MNPKWRVVGRSVKGTAHQKKSLPCQDAHTWHLTEEALIIAVADGAGSAQRSDEGAELAVQAAVDHICASIEEELASFEESAATRLLKSAFEHARQAIITHADSAQLPARVFATTLTCAIISERGWAVGQIGDGVVVCRTEEEQLWCATQPQRGEFANETVFLTQESALRTLQIQMAPQPIDAIAVMTDGLIRLALDMSHYQPHTPFFTPMFGFTRQITNQAEAETQLAAFLASERVCARTDDDKTLVLAVRTNPNPKSNRTARG